MGGVSADGHLLVAFGPLRRARCTPSTRGPATGRADHRPPGPHGLCVFPQPGRSPSATPATTADRGRPSARQPPALRARGRRRRGPRRLRPRSWSQRRGHVGVVGHRRNAHQRARRRPCSLGRERCRRVDRTGHPAADVGHRSTRPRPLPGQRRPGGRAGGPHLPRFGRPRAGPTAPRRRGPRRRAHHGLRRRAVDGRASGTGGAHRARRPRAGQPHAHPPGNGAAGRRSGARRGRGVRGRAAAPDRLDHCVVPSVGDRGTDGHHPRSSRPRATRSASATTSTRSTSRIPARRRSRPTSWTTCSPGPSSASTSATRARSRPSARSSTASTADGWSP